MLGHLLIWDKPSGISRNGTGNLARLTPSPLSHTHTHTTAGVSDAVSGGDSAGFGKGVLLGSWGWLDCCYGDMNKFIGERSHLRSSVCNVLVTNRGKRRKSLLCSW